MTVQDLIYELERHDRHATVGVECDRTSFEREQDPGTAIMELERVVPQHDGYKVEVKIIAV